MILSKILKYLPTCRMFYVWAAFGFVMVGFLIFQDYLTRDLVPLTLLGAVVMAFYWAGVHAAEVFPEDVEAQGWTPPEAPVCDCDPFDDGFSSAIHRDYCQTQREASDV